MTASRRAVLGVVGALAVFAAACGGDGDDVLERAEDAPRAETTVTTTEVVPTAPDPAPEPVPWEPCGPAECATVAMPLDHSDPQGGTIDVFVRRLPATGDRIGALFFNFGGPGAGAANLIDAFRIPADIRARFDIVGMDPRGVGRSTPLDCGVDPRTLYSVDHTVEDDADAQVLVDISEEYAEDCRRVRGELLPHVGTRAVAQDMDLIRARMGDEQLSFVGYSYGTSIGQAYADQFPDRVRALVLDGIVDPAPSGIDTAAQQARGFEAALANWAAGCPARSTCPFDDALSAVDRMLGRAEDGLPSRGGRDLGPGEAAVGLAYPLYQASLWSALDRAVADALEGDGTAMVALADDYTHLVDFSIYFAVSCLDSSWPRSTPEFLARAESAGAESPRFGEAIVNDYIRCAVWPAEPDPLSAITAPGTPPILVVSTTGDPATPYENGVTVADRLESAVLLTNEGEGHTIVFQGSACVDDLVRDYLIDLAVPADGTRC